MFCRECGKKNDPHASYCRYDGYPLKAEQGGRLWPAESMSCMECGAEKSDPAARYCTACGSSFDTYEIADPASVTPFNAELGRKVLPGFLLSAGLLFVISQLIVLFVGKIERPSGYLQLQLPVDQPVIESLNFLDFSLFANLTSITLTLGNDDFTQHISYVSSGLAFMAVVAVLALVPGGFLVKRLNPGITAWRAPLFCNRYGALLGILSLLAGVDNVSGHGHYQTSIDFCMWSAVINGVFLGFAGSYAGMGLRSDRHMPESRSINDRAICFGIFTVMAGYVLMVLVSVILNAQYEPQLETDPAVDVAEEQRSTFASWSFVAKMGSYLFHLAIGNSFIVNIPGPESETVTYSFLSGELAARTSDIAFLIPPDFFASSEIIILVLTAVFFIGAGFLLANVRGGTVRTIAIYSFAVAVMMTFLHFTHRRIIRSKWKSKPINFMKIHRYFSGSGCFGRLSLVFCMPA